MSDHTSLQVSWWDSDAFYQYENFLPDLHTHVISIPGGHRAYELLPEKERSIPRCFLIVNGMVLGLLYILNSEYTEAVAKQKKPELFEEVNYSIAEIKKMIPAINLRLFGSREATKDFVEFFDIPNAAYVDPASSRGFPELFYFRPVKHEGCKMVQLQPVPKELLVAAS